MKEISLYIRSEDFSKVVNILRKNNVGGITFFETNGSGRTKHKPVPERVRMYMTGKMVTPEFVKGTKVEVIVPDSSADQIIEDILNNLNSDNTDTGAHGMIFVKDVYGAYEIGTKQKGESVLIPK
jgi:nitrogen regulatory protein P-II 1